MAGAGFINDINRLVRQVAVVDVARRQFHRDPQRLVSILDVVMLLEPGLQALENLVALLDRWLDHVNFLEAPRQRPILLENAAIFLISSRTDALHFTRRQHRFDQVRGVHHAAGSRAGADDGVNLVNEQDGVALLAQLGQH